MSGDSDGCPGSWTGDEDEELHGKKGNSEENSDEFMDGNHGEGGEKLDPLDAKQIHGSNPTKLHHTSKSQKMGGGGYFWWGIFGFKTKTTKSS